MRIAGHDLEIARTLHTTVLPSDNITAEGFGPTSYRRVLYLVPADGRPVFVWGVSYRGGAKPPPDAAAVLEQVRAVIGHENDLGGDPVPDLPVTALSESVPPPGAQMEGPSVGPLVVQVLPGLVSTAFAVLIVAGGFQLRCLELFLGLWSSLPPLPLCSEGSRP